MVKMARLSMGIVHNHRTEFRQRRRTGPRTTTRGPVRGTAHARYGLRIGGAGQVGVCTPAPPFTVSAGRLLEVGGQVSRLHPGRGRAA